MISNQKRIEIEREYRKTFEQAVLLCVLEDRMSCTAIAKMLGVTVDAVEMAASKISDTMISASESAAAQYKFRPYTYFVESVGKMMTAKEISAEFGVSKKTLQDRLYKASVKNGDTVPDWAIKPATHQATYVYCGEKNTVLNLSKKLRIPARYVDRIIKGNGIPAGGEIPARLLGKGSVRKYRYDGKLRTVREIASLVGKTCGAIRSVIHRNSVSPFQSLDFMRHDHSTKKIRD